MVETRNLDFSIIFSQLVSKWQDVTPKNGGCKAEEAKRIFSLVPLAFVSVLFIGCKSALHHFVHVQAT